MKVLQAKIKRDNDKYWNDVGLTVFMKDDGKVAIKDSRTGEFYQCFEPKKREDSERQDAPSAQDPDSDLPF